jgi:hypothetical protein
MKLNKFSQFLAESDSKQNLARLAKLGLIDGLRVLEWWVDPTPNPDQPGMVMVNWKEYYNWPNEHEDDLWVIQPVKSDLSRGNIKRRMTRFAMESELDWLLDRETGEMTEVTYVRG